MYNCRLIYVLVFFFICCGNKSNSNHPLQDTINFDNFAELIKSHFPNHELINESKEYNETFLQEYKKIAVDSIIAVNCYKFYIKARDSISGGNIFIGIIQFKFLREKPTDVLLDSLESRVSKFHKNSRCMNYLTYSNSEHKTISVIFSSTYLYPSTKNIFRLLEKNKTSNFNVLE